MQGLNWVDPKQYDWFIGYNFCIYYVVINTGVLFQYKDNVLALYGSYDKNKVIS